MAKEKSLVLKEQDTKDREIILSRLIDAPRNLVFKVWTDPDHIKHWYGPNGFTITNHHMELKKGGRWRFMMHGPDGVDYPNRVEFLEIVKPERLVFNHGFDVDNDPGKFHVTITFESQGNKTLLTMHSVFVSVEEFNKVVKEYGAIEGGKQTLNRFEDYVTKLHAPVVIERTFPASASKIWKALTDKDEMKKWYFDIPEFKPEVGLEFQFLAGSKEKKWLHLCKVTEVIPEKKIAYTWRYDGSEGNSEVSFELIPEGNQTRLQIVHKGLETFPANNPDLAKHNFVKGWTGFMDKALPEYLRTSQ